MLNIIKQNSSGTRINNIKADVSNHKTTWAGKGTSSLNLMKVSQRAITDWPNKRGILTKKYLLFKSPTQLLIHIEWWSYQLTQWLHLKQCEERIGWGVAQTSQYLYWEEFMFERGVMTALLRLLSSVSSVFETFKSGKSGKSSTAYGELLFCSRSLLLFHMRSVLVPICTFDIFVVDKSSVLLISLCCISR